MEVYTGGAKTGNLFQKENQVVTNLVLPKGEATPEHAVPYTVVVVPVKGRLIFTAGDQEEEIYPGRIIRMEPEEHHALLALEDSEVIVVKSLLYA